MKKLFIYLCLLVIIMVGGCQQDELLDRHHSIVYLSLPEDTDFLNLSVKDQEVFYSAISRVKIVESEDGLLVLITKSGRDINISENIYDWCYSSIESRNKHLLSGTIISRSDFTPNGESNTNTTYYPTDCVAHAIGAASSYSYSEVNETLTAKYGSNGIGLSNIEEAISLFGHVSQISPVDYSGSVVDKNIIAIIDNGNGGAHAVNVVRIDGCYITYADYQAIYYNQSYPAYPQPLNGARLYRIY